MTRFILSLMTVLTVAWTMSARAATNSKGSACQAPSRVEYAAKVEKNVADMAKKAVVNTVQAAKTLTSSMKEELAKASEKATSIAKAGGNHLARLTAYWSGEGDYYTRRHISSTGVILHNGHCAVDPSIIPYGSVVDIEGLGRFLAVDTGTAVVTRRAARESGHNHSERSALVIDLYFENRREGEQFAAQGPKFASVTWWKPGDAEASTLGQEAVPHSMVASDETFRSKAL